MQNTDATYRALLAAGARKEVQAWIYCGGTWVRYPQSTIISATVRASMLDSDMSIGNCIAKSLHIVLTNYADKPAIPRMAAISMQFRLTDGETSSEWYPKGRYFIDTRDEANGVLTIDAYDAMLKGEVQYMQSGEQGTWPKPAYDIIFGFPGENLEPISSRLGVELDPRTADLLANSKGFEVGYPGYGEGAYTVRQVLGYIGSMYGGNWVITDENKLRLIVLGDIPAQNTRYLVNESGQYITMGGGRILVS